MADKQVYEESGDPLYRVCTGCGALVFHNALGTHDSHHEQLKETLEKIVQEMHG